MGSRKYFPFNSLGEKQRFSFVLRLIEFFVLLASLLAGYFHFKAAGKQLTEVGRFHIAHCAYCGLFSIAKIIVSLVSGAFVKYFTNPDVALNTIEVFGSACSVWYLPYDSFNVMLILTMCLFFNYWDKVYSTNPHRRIKCRKLFYFNLFLLWLGCEIVEISVRPCTAELYWPLIMTYHLFDAVFFVDSLWVFYLCARSNWNQLSHAHRSCECTKAVRTVALFGVLSLSYLIAVGLNMTETILVTMAAGKFEAYGYRGVGTLRLFFNLIFPSLCLLIIMWKRHYMEVDTLAPLEWHDNPHRSTEILLTTVTSTFDQVTPGAISGTTTKRFESDDLDDDENDNEEDGPDESVDFSDAFRATQGEQGRIPADMAKGIRFIGPLTSDIRIPAPPSPVVEFQEDLRPPACVLKLLKAFLSQIVLPASEVSLVRLNSRVAQFIQAMNSSPRLAGNATTTTTNNRSARARSPSVYEHLREFDRVKLECDSLTASVAQWIGIIRAVVEQIPNEEESEEEEAAAAAELVAGSSTGATNTIATTTTTDSSSSSRKEQQQKRAFKSSAQKNNLAYAHMATNLQVHRTVATWWQKEGGGASSSGGADADDDDRGGGLEEDEEEGMAGSNGKRCALSVVTFGAPAAHALKFKAGGLHRIKASLRTLEKEAEDAAKTSPQAILSRLRLEAALACREGVVVGQALGAAVAAAAELLATCLEERNEALLRQVGQVGLLLHSACLLSTHGKENSMVEDFRGVYDMLQLSLRLEAPARDGNAETAAATATASQQQRPLADASSSPSMPPPSKRSSGQVRVRFKGLAAADLLRDPSNGGSHLCGGDGATSSSVGRVRVSLSVEPTDTLAWATAILLRPQPATTPGGGGGRGGGGGEGEEPSLRDISVVPVLFTLGVNEMQTLAHAAGSTVLQTEVNREGVRALAQYHARWKKHRSRSRLIHQRATAQEGSTTATTITATVSRVAADATALEDGKGDGGEAQAEEEEEVGALLEQLSAAVEAEGREQNKDVAGVLLLSCHVARLMGGARTTSCKSAKDRTSVFHTLEVARLAKPAVSPDAFVRVGSKQRAFAPPATAAAAAAAAAGADGNLLLLRGKKGVGGSRASGGVEVMERAALDALRDLGGVRLRNAQLNVGKPKYAFNQLQLEALPHELRPPASTASGGKS